MAAAIQLEREGHIVLSPAVLPVGLKAADYMRITGAMLEAAEAVYMLKNWKDSDGAQIEYALAVYTGKRVLLQDDPLDDLEEKIRAVFGPKSPAEENRKEQGARVSAEIDEACVAGLAAGLAEKPQDAVVEHLQTAIRTAMQPKPEHVAGYKGFLLIRCPACGDTKGFCVKSEIRETKCRACGETFPVADLRPLFLNCPACGSGFKYYTNIDEPVTWPCLTCKTPVDLELNAAGTAMVTRRKAPEQGAAAMPQR